MSKFFKHIVTIIGIAASLAGIIGLYYQINSKKPVIEVKAISLDKLTDLPSVDGLKASYTFNNDTIKSLWKLNYLVSNVGDEIIIGKGGKKNIINDFIGFDLNSNYRILEINTYNESFPFNIKIENNNIDLKFLQWKPNELFELVIYAEQMSDENVLPKLTTNEREIINAEVNYTSLSKEIESRKNSIFDQFPKPLKVIIKWFSYFFYGLILLIIPFGFILEILKYFKYKNWKRSKSWLYRKWVEELIRDNKLKEYTEPKNLPHKLWLEYPYIKPDFPNNDFKTLFLSLLFAFIIFAIPMLFLIKI